MRKKTAFATFEAISSMRRSMRSARTPATGMMPTLPTARVMWTRPRAVAEPVSSRTSQLRVSISDCCANPDPTWANHRSRKSRYLSESSIDGFRGAGDDVVSAGSLRIGFRSPGGCGTFGTIRLRPHRWGRRWRQSLDPPARQRLGERPEASRDGIGPWLDCRSPAHPAVVDLSLRLRDQRRHCRSVSWPCERVT